MWPFARKPTFVQVLLGNGVEPGMLAIVNALAHLDDHSSDDPQEGLNVDTADEQVLVNISDLTQKQLLVLILQQQRMIIESNQRMEARMSDLTAAVDELKGAVDGVAQRLLPQIQQLEASLADAEQKLGVALSDDAAAAQVFADAQAAAANIRTEVGRLNALGSEPATPVDPNPSDPVDPPPVEVDPDPNA